MSRNAVLRLAAFVGFCSVGASATMGQAPAVRSTLDAQFPSDQEYVVAVWFEKKDKAATFQYRIMDASIPGNYNRQAWENAKLKWNDPDGAGVMRIFPVRTTQSSRQTERQQVMARVQQERDRIEFQDPKFVDVKPEKKKGEITTDPVRGSTKKDSGKTTFSYDENAKKLASVDKPGGMKKAGTDSQDEKLRKRVIGTWSTTEDNFEYIHTYNPDGTASFRILNFGRPYDSGSKKWKIENGKFYDMNHEGKFYESKFPDETFSRKIR
jgi:hypothetical protein